MPKHYNQPECEWSHLVEMEHIERGAKTINFEASAAQREDLARRLGVLSVEQAKASITLQKVGGGMVQAIGMVEADVTQNCVVSLVPVTSHIRDDFEGWFGDKAAAVNFAKAKSDLDAKKGHVEQEMLDEAVDPEPIIGGKMDVGELATQYLCLAIDPYPHAPGVSAEFVATPPNTKAGEGAQMRKNPFEALKDWKEKR